MYKLIFKKRAIEEIRDSYIYYELKQKGLGEKFEKTVNTYLDTLEINPTQFRISYKIFREIVIQEFPFIIIYYVLKIKKEVVIMSFFHTSKNPIKKY
jgi:plasmid stabilization system protein ParE